MDFRILSILALLLMEGMVLRLVEFIFLINRLLTLLNVSMINTIRGKMLLVVPMINKGRSFVPEYISKPCT